jgi:hypothetical protein
LLKKVINLVMGLLDKTRPPQKGGSVEFSKEELKFILAKLRTAEYKGTEFEMFYNVYTKVQDRLDQQNT